MGMVILMFMMLMMMVMKALMMFKVIALWGNDDIDDALGCGCGWW